MLTEQSEQVKSAIAWELDRVGAPAGFPAFPDIPSDRYTDPAFFELEQRHLWTSSWVYAGRAESIVEPGSFFTFDDLGAPIVVVRGRDGQIRAFANSCRHRGAPVVRDVCGRASSLVCQYHAWTYDITDGSLLAVPSERDFVGLRKSERGLREYRCAVWQGWIFVNQDPDASDLQTWLGPVADQMDCLHGADLRQMHCERHTLSCNWKIVVESFLEVYHFPHIHKRSGGTLLNNRGATMELYPRGHSRMVVPFSKSAWREAGMSDWSDWHPLPECGIPRIPDVPPVFDCTSLSFNLFPNLVTPLGAACFPFLQMWPVDVSTTHLDVIHFGLPADDPLYDQAWAERIAGFRQIIEEDKANMAPMNRSLASDAISGVPLNYQERRLWWLNEEIDRAIGIDNIPTDLQVPQLLGGYARSAHDTQPAGAGV